MNWHRRLRARQRPHVDVQSGQGEIRKSIGEVDLVDAMARPIRPSGLFASRAGIILVAAGTRVVNEW